MICVLKCIKLRPLDRDPTIVMRFRALNRGRYNSTLKSHARSMIGGPCVHAIDARISNAPLIQHLSFIHMAWIVDPHGLHLKQNMWNIVPHGKNKGKLSV